MRCPRYKFPDRFKRHETVHIITLFWVSNVIWFSVLFEVLPYNNSTIPAVWTVFFPDTTTGGCQHGLLGKGNMVKNMRHAARKGSGVNERTDKHFLGQVTLITELPKFTAIELMGWGKPDIGRMIDFIGWGSSTGNCISESYRKKEIWRLTNETSK